MKNKEYIELNKADKYKKLVSIITEATLEASGKKVGEKSNRDVNNNKFKVGKQKHRGNNKKDRNPVEW